MNCQKINTTLRRLVVMETTFYQAQYDLSVPDDVEQTWRQVEAMRTLRAELDQQIVLEITIPEVKQERRLSVKLGQTLRQFIDNLYTQYKVIDFDFYSKIVQESFVAVGSGEGFTNIKYARVALRDGDTITIKRKGIRGEGLLTIEINNPSR